jgi:hypothetical protein
MIEESSEDSRPNERHCASKALINSALQGMCKGYRLNVLVVRVSNSSISAGVQEELSKFPVIVQCRILQMLEKSHIFVRADRLTCKTVRPLFEATSYGEATPRVNSS